jgi:hypothetical protein
MIVTERDFLAQKEYYKDQMRAAQRYHLARQAQSGRQRDKRFYAQALVWLMSRIAAWRTRSRDRYDTMAPSAVPQTR